MHFVVFIPGHATLQDVGLGHLSENVSSQTLHSGPTEESGTIYGWWTNKGAVCMRHDDGLTWIPAVQFDEFEAGRYWVGLDTEKPPTPEDMQRAYPYSGEKIVMGDGMEWLIPIAERLPFDVIRADDGTDRYIPQRKFHEFTTAASYWTKLFESGDVSGKCTWSQLRDFIELGLCANYRTTREVNDYLRLFSGSESGTIYKAAMTICLPEKAKAWHG